MKELNGLKTAEQDECLLLVPSRFQYGVHLGGQIGSGLPEMNPIEMAGGFKAVDEIPAVLLNRVDVFPPVIAQLLGSFLNPPKVT